MLYWIVSRDGQNSVTHITDSTGALVETYEYTPYGEPTIKDSSGTVISESSIGNSLMFCGYYYDEETGLYYVRNRYYDPRNGRFLQTDPLGYFDGMNVYSYCTNDPLNYVDPLGQCKGGNSANYDQQKDMTKKIVETGWFIPWFSKKTPWHTEWGPYKRRWEGTTGFSDVFGPIGSTKWNEFGYYDQTRTVTKRSMDIKSFEVIDTETIQEKRTISKWTGRSKWTVATRISTGKDYEEGDMQYTQAPDGRPIVKSSLE